MSYLIFFMFQVDVNCCFFGDIYCEGVDAG